MWSSRACLPWIHDSSAARCLLYLLLLRHQKGWCEAGLREWKHKQDVKWHIHWLHAIHDYSLYHQIRDDAKQDPEALEVSVQRANTKHGQTDTSVKENRDSASLHKHHKRYPIYVYTSVSKNLLHDVRHFYYTMLLYDETVIYNELVGTGKDFLAYCKTPSWHSHDRIRKIIMKNSSTAFYWW